MKIKDVAHNHSLTDLLKVGIFSILMLAPMINVGVRSAYVICNKNAYQSYSDREVLQETYVNNETLLKENNYYQLDIEKFIELTNDNLNRSSYILSYKEQINWATYDTNITNDIIENSKSFKILRANASYVNIQLFDNNSTQIYNLSKNITAWNDFTSEQLKKYFTLTNFTTSSSVIWGNYLIQFTYTNHTLDNVFEYSVNQLTESPLYNWVENTAIYSGVALMNTQLGITQPVISLLVVYWLLLTIIYVIIDIVIRVFTWLTHMIGSKTA